jgi:hypothetical protein
MQFEAPQERQKERPWDVFVEILVFVGPGGGREGGVGGFVEI